MNNEQKAELERLHARHANKATYYSVSSILKPGKDESLKPEDRIYQKACEICGFLVEEERK